MEIKETYERKLSDMQDQLAAAQKNHSEKQMADKIDETVQKQKDDMASMQQQLMLAINQRMSTQDDTEMQRKQQEYQ